MIWLRMLVSRIVLPVYPYCSFSDRDSSQERLADTTYITYELRRI